MGRHTLYRRVKTGNGTYVETVLVGGDPRYRPLHFRPADQLRQAAAQVRAAVGVPPNNLDHGVGFGEAVRLANRIDAVVAAVGLAKKFEHHVPVVITELHEPVQDGAGTAAAFDRQRGMYGCGVAHMQQKTWQQGNEDVRGRYVCSACGTL